MFSEARTQMKQVHDRDLIRWAIEKANEINANEFRASYHWVSDFKNKYRIVRRKINKRFTRKQMRNEPKVHESIEKFVSRIRSLRSVKHPPKVFNADQTGFLLETKPNFTLEVEGTRYIHEIVDSKNAATHSITVFPLVGHEGQFILPLLIILQENDGRFGPKVQRTMFQHPDLLITCSKSGKITKAILAQWYREVVFNSRELRGSILLLDSYGMHKDKELIESNRPLDFNIAIEYIPPGTTSKIQPLDNDLNRTFKEFLRNLSLGYCSNHLAIQRKPIHVRDSICLLQLLMFNQVQCPRFKGWIQRAFKKCGYIDSYDPYVGSPTTYCFSPDKVSKSQCQFCEDITASFIRCAWCKRLFCAFHFFFDREYHYCTTYFA